MLPSAQMGPCFDQTKLVSTVVQQQIVHMNQTGSERGRVL
jgi:hypothetical protein